MIKAKSKVTSYLRGALGLEQEGEPTFPKKMAHMRRNSYKSNMSKRRQYAQESTYMFFANMLMCRDKFEGGTYLEKLTDRFAYLHDRFRLWGHPI